MKEVTSAQALALLDDQLKVWETARNNYEALSSVKVKDIPFDGFNIKVQFNPARIVSSSAKVDTQSLKERKCFLCAANRPEIQVGLPFGDKYEVLINPFPIFPRHLTIPDKEHVDQRIRTRMGDMLELAKSLDEFTLFYNGPRCGASAPDHMHFQAGNKGFMHIEKEWRDRANTKVAVHNGARMTLLQGYLRSVFMIESSTIEDAVFLFDKLYLSLEIKPGEEEPMMNVLAWYEAGKWIVAVFPRAQHRPSCYSAEGEGNLLISPASVDMGAVFITPLEKDFEKITAADIREILGEVCLDESESAKVVERIKSII